jgi:hypothetical protein
VPGPPGAARHSGVRSLLQSAPSPLGVEVRAVNRRAGLLPPGLIQPTGVDAVESEFVDESQHNAFGYVVVARDGQGDAPSAAFRSTELEQWCAMMLLNALTTGRPNCCSTQRLSGIPASIASIRPSRCRG